MGWKLEKANYISYDVSGLFFQMEGEAQVSVEQLLWQECYRLQVREDGSGCSSVLFSLVPLLKKKNLSRDFFLMAKKNPF